MRLLVVLANLLLFMTLVSSQSESDSSEKTEENGEPMPYNYKYKILDEDKELYIEKEETKDDNDEVKGFYEVLLATGRIMRVEYVVDKDSGFVPKISYEDRNPFADQTNENEVK